MSTSPSLPQCNGAKKPIILPVPSRQCPTRHPSHLHTQSGSPVRSQLMAVRMAHRWMRPHQNPGVMWRCIKQRCPKPPPMPCRFRAVPVNSVSTSSIPVTQEPQQQFYFNHSFRLVHSEQLQHKEANHATCFWQSSFHSHAFFN